MKIIYTQEEIERLIKKDLSRESVKLKEVVDAQFQWIALDYTDEGREIRDTATGVEVYVRI